MARSRARAWMRDELILALDLYKREGNQASKADQQELSNVLRSIPIDRDLTGGRCFEAEATPR